jgi:hypothetical protein
MIGYRDNLAYYLDENIPLELMTLLRGKNIRVVTVYSDDQIGESDILLLARARKLACVMVTFDLGFYALHKRITEQGKGLTHAGIITVEGTLYKDTAQLADALTRLVVKFEGCPDFLKNQLFNM